MADGVLQYIGARYVPQFYLNSDGTPEWRPGVAFEPLTIVTWNNNSYTSRKPVPAEIGEPSVNPEYWAQTGVYNAQIVQLQNDVTTLQSGMSAVQEDVTDINSKIMWYTPEMFGAVGDGETDDSAAFQAMFDAVPDSAQIACFKAYHLEHTVRCEKNDIMLTGGLSSAEYTPTIHAAAGLAPVFEITGFGFSASHIIFRSVSINNGTIFFDLNRDSIQAAGNIDATFKHCTFAFGGDALMIRGRNVLVESCLITQMRTCMTLKQMSIGGEHRGYIIRDSRFHSSWVAIDNTDGINNSLVKGVLIDGCYFDFGLSIFSGRGGNVVITNNYFHSFGIMTGSGPVIHLVADTENANAPTNIIANNVIIGKGVTETLMARGIEIRGGKVIIKDNIIENFSKHGLYVGSGATAYLINNTFLVCGGESGTWAAEFAAGSGGRIVNNQFYYCTNALQNSGSATEVGTNT